MDIESIVTEQEYNNIRSLSYKEFSIYIMRLVKLCVEESLKTLPVVINHLSQQASYLKGLSDKFYEDNEDLVDHKPLVAKVIEQTEINNPGMVYSKVLERAAPEARRKISMMKNLKTGKRQPIKSYDSKLKEL